MINKLWPRREIEGPDKQKSIYEQHPKVVNWKRNMGTGEGNKFTYAEFMTQLEDGTRTNVATELVAPGSGPDGAPTIHQCSQDLLKKGWATRMPNLDLALPDLARGAFTPPDPKKGKKAGALYNPKDPWNSPMTELASRLDKKFQQLRADFHDDSKWGAYITSKTDRVKDLVTTISTVRAEDSSSFLRKQVSEAIEGTKDPNKPKKGVTYRHGLGLSGNYERHVVSTERRSAFADVNSYAKNWDDITVGQTMQNAWNDDDIRDKLQKVAKFTNAGDLRKWANNLGDPQGEWSERYTEFNEKHFRVAKVWRVALRRINRTPAQAKTC